MISKRVEGTIEGWLSKREDLFEEERQAFIEYVRDMSNVEALATGRWFSNGVVRVPEDQPKVSQAIKVAKIAKVDPLQYKSPMELIDQHASIKLKGEPIDPHTVSTLHKVREFPEYGIEIFDVEESEESRKNMREIINTHFGVNSNPWCLLQGDGEGNLTEESKDYWEHYNGYPKQVAFVNGKLNSFSANDEEEQIWWDRKDFSYEGISLKGKIPNDELDRSGTMIISATKGKMLNVYNAYKGNQQNGCYEQWYPNGLQRLKFNYKDGKLDGLYEIWHPNGQLQVKRCYKDGEVHGLSDEWHSNGQLAFRGTYIDGKLDGLYEEWDEKGRFIKRDNYVVNVRDGIQEEYWYHSERLKKRSCYKKGCIDGLYEEWHKNGTPKVRASYVNDVLNGLKEEWYKDGGLCFSGKYINGVEDGIHESRYFNGVLKGKKTYVNGKLEGLYEEWHQNGRQKLRCNYKDGKLEGLYEEWHQNGRQKLRCNYKDGLKNGSYESWYKGGQLNIKGAYVNDKEDGHYVQWDEDGQIERMGDYKEGVLDGYFEKNYWYNYDFRKGNYVNGKPEGYHEGFDPGGGYWRANFKEGEVHGLWEWREQGVFWYYENGNLISMDSNVALELARKSGLVLPSSKETKNKVEKSQEKKVKEKKRGLLKFWKR